MKRILLFAVCIELLLLAATASSWWYVGTIEDSSFWPACRAWQWLACLQTPGSMAAGLLYCLFGLGEGLVAGSLFLFVTFTTQVLLFSAILIAARRLKDIVLKLKNSGH